MCEVGNPPIMMRVGLIGAGKMGLSHHAILNAHPKVVVAAVADTSGLVLSMLQKYLGVRTVKDYRQMEDIDGVVIATPPQTHADAVTWALEHGLHVFVEKPLCLTIDDGRRLASLADRQGVVNQVGYHNRFLGTFRETKRLVQSGIIGDPYHISGEAYGQVVIKEESSTWRSAKEAGGGCLHEYGSHVIDLMNYVVGPPTDILGVVLKRVYSRDVEDAVYATLAYPDGVSGQLATNWTDETYRRMTARLTVHGTRGKIIVDREECRLYLSAAPASAEFASGWTVRNITQLQPPVAYYLRGEEYTSQLDHFVKAVESGAIDPHASSFASALQVDIVMDRLVHRARGVAA